MQPLHDWHLSAPQARQLQRSLAGRVKLVWDGRRVEKVGGVDVWVGKESARCAIAVLRFPGFEPLHHVTVEVEIT
ncbi:MAG: endonuclease V, partial [Caldilineae bacterium]